MRTLFIGSGGFGVESLRRLASHDDVELVGVVTAPPRPAGRGQRLTSSVVANVADELGLGPILTPERLRAPESIADILDLDPDLLVLADYGQIVPEGLLDVPHGALNIHPSLLPRHRGATPIPATILAGDTETGVSLMRMDAGLDTGPIVDQVRISLDGTETTPSLEEALAVVAGDLVERDLGPWVRGEVLARPQSQDGATLTRPLRREDGRLDPTRSSAELERQVRAYQPWPGSYVDTIAGRVVIWRAEYIGGGIAGEDATPGRIGAFGMYASDGAYIAFREVQPAGGKRMGWDDFVRGRPAIVGSSVIQGA